jgi:hypothetical protein
LRNAGWRSATSWPVLLVEGIVLAVVGAIIWLLPDPASMTVLQLLGVALLLTAGASTWRLVRDVVVPLHVAAVAFRAGVGLSVGLIVILGSLVAEQTDVVTVTLAAVLGIGYVLYGLSVFLAPLVHRGPGSRLPLGASALGVGSIVIGVLLVVRASAGVDTLVDTLSLLGLLMAATGMALTGWALVLKPQEESGAA